VIPSETLTDFVKVEINDADDQSQTLYFGAALDKNISLESFSLPPVPPIGSFDVRIPGGYRVSEKDNVTIEVQASYYPVSVTVTNLKSNQKFNYVLQEIANGKITATHSIIDGETILIVDPKVSSLRINKQEEIPDSYNLVQNYPNPFNPVTTIQFSLPENVSNVKLTIYNALGQKIVELVNAALDAGIYEFQWDAKNEATGIYIYELRTEKFLAVKKMLLLK
jgi:hypothetical protein